MSKTSSILSFAFNIKGCLQHRSRITKFLRMFATTFKHNSERVKARQDTAVDKIN